MLIYRPATKYSVDFPVCVCYFWGGGVKTKEGSFSEREKKGFTAGGGKWICRWTVLFFSGDITVLISLSGEDLRIFRWWHRLIYIHTSAESLSFFFTEKQIRVWVWPDWRNGFWCFNSNFALINHEFEMKNLI